MCAPNVVLVILIHYYPPTTTTILTTILNADKFQSQKQISLYTRTPVLVLPIMQIEIFEPEKTRRRSTIQ